MEMYMKIRIQLVCIVPFMFSPAFAQTAVGSMAVQITIVDDCAISGAETMDFGTQGALISAVDRQANIEIACTDGTAFDIGLDAGINSAGGIAGRAMAGAGGAVSYQLFTTSARQVVWGNSFGSDTVPGTGNGEVLSFTVYGRVPAQTTPAAGNYSDTIGITVTF